MSPRCAGQASIREMRALLIASGLVARLPDAGRKVQTRLTPAGRQALAAGIVVLQRPSAPTLPLTDARFLVLSRGPVDRAQEPRGCRWIDGHPARDGSWAYCQAPLADAVSAYCAPHRTRAYRTDGGDS